MVDFRYRGVLQKNEQNRFRLAWRRPCNARVKLNRQKYSVQQRNSAEFYTDRSV